MRRNQRNRPMTRPTGRRSSSRRGSVISKNIGMYKYVADESTRDALSLVRNEGYRSRPRSKAQLALMLADMVDKDGEAGLIKITNIHPDKELFEKVLLKSVNFEGDDENSNLACNGCSLGADGAQESKNDLSTTNAIIMSGAALVVTSILIMALRGKK